MSPESSCAIPAPSSAQLGRAARWNRLNPSGGPINLVALDHAPSLGWVEGQDTPAEIAASCHRAGVAGVVCNAGSVAAIRARTSIPIFLQLSSLATHGLPKAIVATPHQAAVTDSVGVAVEYSIEASANELAAVAAVTQAAREAGLLVLVMTSYRDDSLATMVRAILGAASIGADLIKVRVSIDARRSPLIASVGLMLDTVPPVLAAGGTPGDDLTETLTWATRAGLGGTCIGRHYFSQSDREHALAAVAVAFPPATRPDGSCPEPTE